MSCDKPGRPGRVFAPLDPALFEAPGMLAALAAHDIATVYRGLVEAGINQHDIARRTGQSQSEVCEILHGRRVGMYAVLVRICDGLGLPREMMGLSYGGRGAYGEPGPVAEPPEGGEEVRRRAFITAVPVALWGQPLFGDTPGLPEPGAVTEDLPSRLGSTDVAEVESWAGHVRAVARQRGGQADVARWAAARAERLLSVPAAEPVAARLGSAVARLHILTGWCCADSDLGGHVWHHFQRAVHLAGHVGDTYQATTALRYAAALQRERGHPNDALKLCQLAQWRIMEAPGDDSRLPVVAAWLGAESAAALADMGHLEQAGEELAKARDGWEPPDNFEGSGMDEVTARVNLTSGRLDVAEQYAAVSARTCGDGERRNGMLAAITHAIVYVRAGEPRGLLMAKTAIDGVGALRSVRARNGWLVPLATSLAVRPGHDARELARVARKVAEARGV